MPVKVIDPLVATTLFAPSITAKYADELVSIVSAPLGTALIVVPSTVIVAPRVNDD